MNLSQIEILKGVEGGLEVLNHDNVMIPTKLRGKLNILERLLLGLAGGQLIIQQAPEVDQQVELKE